MRRASTNEGLSDVVHRNRHERQILQLDEYEEDDRGHQRKPPELDGSREADNTITDDGGNEENSSHLKEDADLNEVKKLTKTKPDSQILRRLESLQKRRMQKKQRQRYWNDQKKYASRFDDISFSTSPTFFEKPEFKDSSFFGIYVLFWLGTAFLMTNYVVHHYFENKRPLWDSVVFQLLRRDLVKIGITDLAMYLASYFAYLVQYCCLKKWISWNRSGWFILSGYIGVYFAFWLCFLSEYVMDYPWIGKVFLLLHTFVFMMKMHSYSYYNGYLWKILEERNFSEAYLKRLEGDSAKIPQGYTVKSIRKVLLSSVEFCNFELEFQKNPMIFAKDDPDDIMESPLKTQVNEFPKNINLRNYFEFTMFPALVYTLNFPRTKKIRWWYVFEKVCAIFGIIFLMSLLADGSMDPIVRKAISCRDLPLPEKSKQYGLLFLDMIPPFLMEYLLTFFLIWDSILNAIAELSKFADRDFYGPWWSCSEWSEFAKLWNRPVHKFLLRHVYHSSISALQLSKSAAVFFTFMLSSVVHELLMLIIFGRLRGYLLLFQMSQIPMIFLSQSKFMKNRKVLGNIICWTGFLSGPSMITILYLMY